MRFEAVTRVEADDDAALRAGLQDVKIEAEERGSTVAITVRDDGQNACGEQEWHRGPAWWDRRRFSSSTELTLTVPRDVRVRLCTVNGDTLAVTGVTGDFDVSNVNGKVVMSGMAGSGSATTVNGGIEASFTASPRAESRFKTVNGTIAGDVPARLRRRPAVEDVQRRAVHRFRHDGAAGRRPSAPNDRSGRVTFTGNEGLPKCASARAVPR